MTQLETAQSVETRLKSGQEKVLQPGSSFLESARLDLTRIPVVRSLLSSRWPQLLIRLAALAGLVFTILTGLLGSQVGGDNFAIIMVWIAWWSALKLFFIPFGGRSWCSVCPIPMPGEWLQSGGLLASPRGSRIGPGKKWPRRLRGSWIQSGGFLLVGLFGAVTLTTPWVTSLVLLAVLALAFTLSLVFERRAFCSYVCPIGGLSGLYAQAAPVEVRVRDARICAAHAEKSCYESCPWGEYPPALKTSANCGLCMECLRVCPSDNIAVNLRPWGGELVSANKARLDQAFFALVMLASALVDSTLFLGPWGVLKSAAYAVGSLPWWIFSGGFLAAALGVVPGLYALAVWLGRDRNDRQTSFRKALADHSQALVTLGLTAWIAFTISFAMVKISYLGAVLSDPFGWGWNLFGLAHTAWVGQTSPVSLYLQIIVLAVGLLWSTRVAFRRAGTWKKALPLAGFSLVFTASMLWLLLG